MSKTKPNVDFWREHSNITAFKCQELPYDDFWRQNLNMLDVKIVQN